MASHPPQPSQPPRGSRAIPLSFSLVFLAGAAILFDVLLSNDEGSSRPAPVAEPGLPLEYPATRTVDVSDYYFGTRVADPYRWLEDGKSPEVQSWVAAENHVARTFLDALPGRWALEQRYTELLHIETITAPSRAGDRMFYMKRRPTDEKAILYWKSATDDDDPEHVLIDPNKFVGTNNASLGGAVPTLDGKLLAYSLKPNNADEATLYVKDIATGADLKGEVITGAKYADPSWLPDGSGFVYTYLPPADPKSPQDRPGLAVIRFHKLGTDPKRDPVLHDKTGDATKFISADVSRDGRWIFFVQQNGWDKNDLWYQPLNGEPTAALAATWRPIVVGKPFLYSLEAWEGQAYILTNEDAPHFHLFKVGMDDPQRAKWREIIPESATAVLQGTAVVGGSWCATTWRT